MVLTLFRERLEETIYLSVGSENRLRAGNWAKYNDQEMSFLVHLLLIFFLTFDFFSCIVKERAYWIPIYLALRYNMFY